MTKLTLLFQDRSAPTIIENVSAFRVDPNIHVLFVETANTDRYYFVLRNLRYWKVEGRAVITQ